MSNYFQTTIQLHIDPFLAENEEQAGEMIDKYLDLITEYANFLSVERPSGKHSRLTWQECDITDIEKVACPHCEGKGEAIAFDGATGLPFEIVCPDCIEVDD